MHKQNIRTWSIHSTAFADEMTNSTYKWSHNYTSKEKYFAGTRYPALCRDLRAVTKTSLPATSPRACTSNRVGVQLLHLQPCATCFFIMKCFWSKRQFFAEGKCIDHRSQRLPKSQIRMWRPSSATSASGRNKKWSAADKVWKEDVKNFRLPRMRSAAARIVQTRKVLNVLNLIEIWLRVVLAARR